MTLAMRAISGSAGPRALVYLQAPLGGGAKWWGRGRCRGLGLGLPGHPLAPPPGTEARLRQNWGCGRQFRTFKGQGAFVRMPCRRAPSMDI
eukprot:2995675-Pyramimonas_sp.AAC.1